MKNNNTEMQNIFLDSLFDDDVKGDIRKAMKKAGYSDNSSIDGVIKPLKDQIIERSQHYLAMNASKAAMAMIGVLDNPNALGAKNAIAAANEVMDRVGITKKDDSIKLPKGSIIYLPPKNSQVPVIEGEFQVVERIENRG